MMFAKILCKTPPQDAKSTFSLRVQQGLVRGHSSSSLFLLVNLCNSRVSSMRRGILSLDYSMSTNEVRENYRASGKMLSSKIPVSKLYPVTCFIVNYPKIGALVLR